MIMSELYNILNIDIVDNRIIKNIVFNIDEIKEDTIFLLVRKKDVIKINDIKTKSPLLIVSSFYIENLLYIPNLKEYISRIFISFYNIDFSKIKLLAITGTEMKSSLAKILFDVLSKQEKVLLISTSYEGENIVSTSLTTPEANIFCQIIDFAIKNNYKKIIFEASSIGIEEHRLDNIIPDEIIVTNLKSDHLDYHKNINNYYNAKKKYISIAKKIFINENTANILNFDKMYVKIDDFISKLNEITYKDIVYKFDNLNELQLGIIPYVLEYLLNNNYNIDIHDIKYPEGRIEILSKTPLVMLDYAHTIFSYEKVLKYFSSIVKGKKIVVFGAGGNREKEKRYDYGKLVYEYSNTAIVTEDNSRLENIDDIINDLIKVKPSYFKIIKDRKKAIKHAFSLITSNNDGILVIGKGIEKFINKENKLIPYNDKNEIEKHLSNKKDYFF